jgi:hypothetical protein
LALEECQFNEATQRELGDRIVAMAESVLAVTCIRGDDPADLPGTFQRAAEGASVLLQLGHELAREAQHA